MPNTGEWVGEMWGIHFTEYSGAGVSNGWDVHAATCIGLKNMVLGINIEVKTKYRSVHTTRGRWLNPLESALN